MNGATPDKKGKGKTMNYTEFIKKADQAAGSMAQERLAAFLHDYARSVPEHKREEFLERLFSFAGKKADADETGIQDALGKEQLKGAIERNMQQLAVINDGELVLEEVYEEMYDGWYDDEEGGILYEDPEHICEVIGEGVKLVHTCVDRELYGMGYDLADFLLAMEISTDGEYGGVELSIQELASQNILDFDYEGFVLDALLAAYWGNDLEGRPDALYWMFKNSSSEKATLELLMQQSQKELGQFQEFLRLWINYLGTVEDKKAWQLLREAVSLVDSPGVLLDTARKFVDCHPGLYMQFLEQCRDKGRIADGLEIGKEAIPRILLNRQVRSEVALVTAEFSLQMEDRDEAEHCWYESFRAVPSVVNYLRLVLEARDYGKWQKAAERVFRGAVPDDMLGSREQYQGSYVYESLLFFSGSIQQMVSEGMREKQALGWSGTFMKEGMALLFLYLYRGEELSVGCRQMCKNYMDSSSFDAKSYFKGTCRGTELEEQQFFWERFCKWREHAIMPEEEAKDMVKRLEHWVKLRVAGIMEHNRRNYYGECAAFVAALGEVEESRGEPGAKKRIMEYRSAYSRRTAFHQELRAFGMEDTRKRK